jgi:hypothetical protein
VVNAQDPEVKKFETQTKETEAADTNTPLKKITSNKSAQTNKLEKRISRFQPEKQIRLVEFSVLKMR